MRLSYSYNDGGRLSAGFKGNTGDCVVRAIAIVTGRPYREIYDALSDGCRSERKTKRGRNHNTARLGVRTTRKWFKEYMRSLGFTWTPTMAIGSGCKVHLADNEIPSGKIIVSLSRHLSAVIDGTIHDTYDPRRDNKRCVYGYYSLLEQGAGE